MMSLLNRNRGVLALTLGLYLAALSSTAMAAPSCPPRDVPKDATAFDKAPPIPKNFSQWMKASKTDLTVATESGKTYCFKLDGLGEVKDFWISADKRFIGFRSSGFEFDGFTVIDRRGTGQEIMTGALPVFSPDKKHFAFAWGTETDWSNFSGLGLWSVGPNGSTVGYVYDREADPGKDPFSGMTMEWKIDRWLNNDTVQFSYLRIGELVKDKDGKQIGARPQRRTFQLKRHNQKWVLHNCAVRGQC
jgi:hypothetical protein